MGGDDLELAVAIAGNCADGDFGDARERRSFYRQTREEIVHRRGRALHLDGDSACAVADAANQLPLASEPVDVRAEADTLHDPGDFDGLPYQHDSTLWQDILFRWRVTLLLLSLVWGLQWPRFNAFDRKDGSHSARRIVMSTTQSVITSHDGKKLWIFDLTPQERSTLAATFGGWGLDGMDVMVYSFVIPTLIAAWHISKAQAGMLGTAALLISALGGWLAGLLADRFCRVRILQITILWFAFFTFLCGFTNSFWQLLITRGLQGLGFGGEWAVGSVLMGEAIRAQHRGKAVGTVQGGWAVGWGFAAICYTLLFSILPA